MVALPTFKVFKWGEEVETVTGLDGDKLKAKLRQLCTGGKPKHHPIEYGSWFQGAPSGDGVAEGQGRAEGRCAGAAVAGSGASCFLVEVWSLSCVLAPLADHTPVLGKTDLAKKAE